MKLSIALACASLAAFTRALPGAILTVAAVPVVVVRVGRRAVLRVLRG